jgi:hypothetical protein
MLIKSFLRVLIKKPRRKDFVMYCTVCGEKISEDSKVTAYSSRINDPAFSKYLKNSSKYALIFSVVIAVIAVVGFYIAGERGADNLENPESLYIGLGIGGMFIFIALLKNLSQKRSKTWDGKVVNKTVEQKTKKVQYGDTYQREPYVEYKVMIQPISGKLYTLRHEDDQTVYNYYQIGDEVRHHKGLNTFEKKDKSKDQIIFCAACASLCDIKDDYCHRCKCPLLK